MNWDRFLGNCKQVVGKAQQVWGGWMEDELLVLSGRQRQLAGRLQERCGRACEAAEREIASWDFKVPRNVVWLHGEGRRRRDVSWLAREQEALPTVRPQQLQPRASSSRATHLRVLRG
jgi:uncharacterized protein YjbJ (UPF0337 family)